MTDVFGSVPGTEPVIANPVEEPEKGPSAIGFVIGAVLIVVGVVGSILWGVNAFVRYDRAIDDMERVVVGSVETVDLDEGEYVVYAERGGGLPQSTAIGEFRIREAGEGGSRIDVLPYESEFTYDTGSRSGRAQYTFSIEDDGDYDVLAEDINSATRVAIGESLSPIVVKGLVGAFTIGTLGVVLGVIFLVVTGVRRRKFRRRNWHSGWTGPGGTVAPPPGQPAWGQPAPGQPAWGQPQPPPPAPGAWGAPPSAPPPPQGGAVAPPPAGPPTAPPPPPASGLPPPTPPA